MNNKQSISPFYKAVEGAKYLFLATMTIIFLVELGLSLSWQIQTDGSVLHYFAYLITEHGFVPYRDIFDPNMPGIYLFHMAIGTLFGYSDLAFRLVDVAWLTATLTVTWLLMKPFGRVVAFASCLLFGLIYLGAGPYMSLQRDYIAILPVATALLITTRRGPNQPIHLTHFLIGVLFALAALVKPHMAIALPAMLLYSCLYNIDRPRTIKTLIIHYIVGGFLALAGFLATAIIPFLWLWQIGSLESFLTILSSYVPLYSQMSRDMEFRALFPRILNIVYWYIRLGGFGILLTSALFGVHLILTRSTSTETKRVAIFLLSLSVLYSIYVVIGSRFLDYHWMPFVYFASLSTALMLFSRPPLAQTHSPNLLPYCGFIVTTMVVTLLPAYDAVQHLLSGEPPTPIYHEQIVEITAYLDDHLLPTDTVQPLATNGGALHAMRISETAIATPYVYDFQFYHHISTSYIQQIREHFLIELEEAMPTLIVEVHEKYRVVGVDTTDEFPELRIFIEQNYSEDYTGNDFTVFRRDDN